MLCAPLKKSDGGWLVAAMAAASTCYSGGWHNFLATLSWWRWHTHGHTTAASDEGIHQASHLLSATAAATRRCIYSWRRWQPPEEALPGHFVRALPPGHFLPATRCRPLVHTATGDEASTRRRNSLWRRCPPWTNNFLADMLLYPLIHLFLVRYFLAADVILALRRWIGEACIVVMLCYRKCKWCCWYLTWYISLL